MHFLSDLGKIKPRNEEKRCILGLERLTLGVWGHCGAQNKDFSSLKGAGQVTVTKEVWTYFTRQKPILVPDGPRPKRETFLDIFWRVFIIYGIYFAWNWPEMHFLRHFWVKISQMPQKWSFFALNLHKKCNSGRFWAKKSPERMKKHIKISEKVFRGGLGLSWSSKEVKMTKCCLMCIRAQAPLEEA